MKMRICQQIFPVHLSSHCSWRRQPSRRSTPLKSAAKSAGKEATVAEAKAFLDDAEARCSISATRRGRAAWVQENFITDDTEALTPPRPSEQAMTSTVALAKAGDSASTGCKLAADTARKMKLLQAVAHRSPPRPIPRKREELTQHRRSHGGHLRQGQVLRARATAAKRPASTSTTSTKIMATSRDPAELLDAWTAGTPSPRPCASDYARYVELANKGARELGFADIGAMWRSKYDMPPDDFRQGGRPAVGAGEAALLNRCTLRAHDSWPRNTARRWCPPTGRSPRTCSATCGRRSGTTSIRLVEPPKPSRQLRPDEDPARRARPTPCGW